VRWNIESLLRWVWRQWGRPLIPEWITGSLSTLWSGRACAAVVQGQGEFVWRNKPKNYGSERGNITGYVPDSDSCKLLVSQKGLNLTFFSHAQNAPKKVSFKNPAYFQHEKKEEKKIRNYPFCHSTDALDPLPTNTERTRSSVPSGSMRTSSRLIQRTNSDREFDTLSTANSFIGDCITKSGTAATTVSGPNLEPRQFFRGWNCAPMDESFVENTYDDAMTTATDNVTNSIPPDTKESWISALTSGLCQNLKQATIAQEDSIDVLIRSLPSYLKELAIQLRKVFESEENKLATEFVCHNRGFFISTIRNSLCLSTSDVPLWQTHHSGGWG